MHLPKTGGTTLNDILRRQFTRRSEIFRTGHADTGEAARLFLELPPARRQATRLITGHTAYGIHAHIGRPVSYFTLLRDPVERVISYFHFVRAKPWHLGHREFNEMTFDAFVESEWFPASDNEQSRLISGLPPGTPDDELLRQARANLQDHIRVVGLTEDFDSTLLLFQRAFGWRPPYYVRRNVTQTRPTQAQVSERTLEIIRARTVADSRLYADAATLFRAAVARQGPDFAADVAYFQRINREYQAIDTGMIRLRRPFGIARRAFANVLTRSAQV